jgi:hypothetical protein
MIAIIKYLFYMKNSVKLDYAETPEKIWNAGQS